MKKRVSIVETLFFIQFRLIEVITQLPDYCSYGRSSQKS